MKHRIPYMYHRRKLDYVTIFGYISEWSYHHIQYHQWIGNCISQKVGGPYPTYIPSYTARGDVKCSYAMQVSDCCLYCVIFHYIFIIIIISPLLLVYIPIITFPSPNRPCTDYVWWHQSLHPPDSRRAKIAEAAAARRERGLFEGEDLRIKMCGSLRFTVLGGSSHLVSRLYPYL